MKRRVLPFVPPLALALGAAVTLTYASLGAAGWDARYAHLLTRVSGWCAVVALLLCLSCTPLRRLLRWPRLPESVRTSAFASSLAPLRRAFGVTSAMFAAAHALTGLLLALRGAALPVWTWSYLRAGLVALVILLLLLATSSPRLNRALRVREFKPLHRLVYAALPFVLLHLALGPFTATWATLTVALLSAALLALRLAPRVRRG